MRPETRRQEHSRKANALVETFDHETLLDLLHATKAQAHALTHVDRQHPDPEIRDSSQRLKEAADLLDVAVNRSVMTR